MTLEVVTKTVKGETTWRSPHSGFSYVLRMVSDAAFTKVLKSVPSLSSETMNGKLTPEQIEQGALMKRGLVRAAIVTCDFPEWDGDVGALPYVDVATIQTWIQTGKGLAGPEADTARGLL